MRSLYAVIVIEQVEKAGDFEYVSYSFLDDVQLFKTLTEARRWIEKDAKRCESVHGWSDDRKTYSATANYQDGNHWTGVEYTIKLVKNPNER